MFRRRYELNRFFLTSFLLFALSVLLQAKGTSAGTSISNQAQIDYIVGGIDNNLTSNADTFVVDRIVHVTTDWQDNAPVEVSAGDTDRVLSFVVANLGNGDDNITLGYEHNASSDFHPQNTRLFEDTDGNGRYDPGVDAAVTQLYLAADANVTLFVVGDIPDDNTTRPGARSRDGIQAESNATATPGADRQDQVDTVVIQKSDTAEGIWQVYDYWLSTTKHALVHSEDNATHTGTRITYTIDTWIDGNATGRTISNVVITDSIPSGTAYTASSLALDGAALSDAADGDAGEVVGGVVTVRIGTLSGTTHKKVSFDVEVE